MNFSPIEVKANIVGLQAFLCTPFTDDNKSNPQRLREHINELTSSPGSLPSGCFVCCGMGEFWSLNDIEYKILVKAAVQELGGKLPVISGVGYGTKLAIEYTRTAEDVGADGVLVFPPYLVAASQEGLLEHYKQIAKSTRLAVIVYNRDNAIFEPETVTRLSEIPNIIGLKDGKGNMDYVNSYQKAAGDRLVLINGMPSAEMFAESYFNIGIRSYSPGVVDFLPELSWILDRALNKNDKELVRQLIEQFYKPYTLLRNKGFGYGVSFVKSGLQLRGKSVGSVRLPLMNPTREHIAELENLIDIGLELVKIYGNDKSVDSQEVRQVA